MTQTAYEILATSVLSQPRMMGTPNEEQTKRFLVQYLKSHGLQPAKEEIEWTTAGFIARKVMYLMIGALMVGLTLLFYLPPLVNAIGSLFLLGLGLGGIIYFGKLQKGDKLWRLGRASKAENVIASIAPHSPSSVPPREIFLTAHSDSVAVSSPKWYIKLMVGAGLGFLLFVVGIVLHAIIEVILFSNGGPGLVGFQAALEIFLTLVSFLVICALALNVFSKRVNISPGACDNGSGSAILLELAARFQQAPPENVNLTFVWCTAEEWGLYGSKGYVKAHKADLEAHKDQIKVINVDMVGSELAYLDKSGFLRKKPLNKTLNTQIGEIASRLGIEARKFKSLIGGNSDHASFQKLGIEVACFLAKKDTKKIHSSLDTLDVVDPQHTENAVKLIAKLIQTLDLDGQ